MRMMLWLLLLVGCTLPPADAPALSATTTPALLPVPTATWPVPTPTPAPVPTPTATLAPLPQPTAAIPADLVLVGAMLIDGSGAAPLPDAVIAIRSGRIVAVGQVGKVPLDPAAKNVQLQGMTILPGLINAHAHTDQLSDAELRAFTQAGVTTLRDMAGPLEPLVARVQRLEQSGDLRLPRLRISGPMLTVPGGHPIAVYGTSDESLAVRTVEEAERVTNELIDAGVHHIKIAVSGRTDVSWPELSDQQITAITSAAHARGVRVTAHIDRAVALRRAILAGIDDAGHMPRDRMSDELIQLMVERGVGLVPTIDVYENLAETRANRAGWRRDTLPIMADNLRRFVAAGGILALGDDYGNPGVALGMPMDEIEKWQEAGLNPMQILVAATQGSAIICGIEQELGTLQVGKLADLLVVEGNPLDDLQVLKQVRMVVRNGEVVMDVQRP